MNVTELCFPGEGSLICPPGRLMIFHKKEAEKIGLVARPGMVTNSSAGYLLVLL